MAERIAYIVVEHDDGERVTLGPGLPNVLKDEHFHIVGFMYREQDDDEFS